MNRIYENNEDRTLQSEAVAILRAKMPHMKLVQTPEVYRLEHDYVIHDTSGVKVGVGEIKCRQYNAEFFEKFPWVLECERLNSLWKENEAKGFPVTLVLYTKDKVVFCIPLAVVAENRDKLEEAEPWMMKDNHGTKLANKRGLLVPFELLDRIGDSNVQTRFEYIP